MPGKSRQGKSRQRGSKKSRAIVRQAAAPAPLQAASGLAQSAPAGAAASNASQPLAAIKKTLEEHQFVGGELRRISILTVALIVILIVLSRVLS